MPRQSKKTKPEAVRTWEARIRATYSTVVEVVAPTREEAREKIKNGEWSSDRNDELVDWTDPSSDLKEIE